MHAVGVLFLTPLAWGNGMRGVPGLLKNKPSRGREEAGEIKIQPVGKLYLHSMHYLQLGQAKLVNLIVSSSLASRSSTN